MPNVNIIESEPGDATPDSEYTPDGRTENGQAQPQFETGDSLFDAPDLAQFVAHRKTAVSREYENKVRAMLKGAMIGALNTNNFPDAAAIIHRGPAFAAAAGTLADKDERAQKAIDLIATPGNPYFLFIATAIPLFAQLLRNHETQLQEVPATWRNRKVRKAARAAEANGKPKFTVHLPFGRSIKIGFRFKFGKLFAGFKAQTYDPAVLAETVFSDPKVIRELEKQGITLVRKASPV